MLRSLFLGLSAYFALLVAAESSYARGVTPYLPLNLAPDIERQIERVLILGDKPVIRRPIAAADVLDALPKACEVDENVCRRVKEYLRRYMGDFGITHLQATGALTNGDSTRVIPNAHGMRLDSAWNVSGLAFYQPSDFLSVSAGVDAYEGRVTPNGSLLSLGFSYAQLDLGYRDHWFSPSADSSTLISTEAPTMPSITLSNYEPISPLGITYEVFLAQMSRQENIRFFNTTTSGHPRLAGLQTAIAPADGYSLSFNRLFQYGGGARTAGTSQFIDALFKNSNRSDSGQESEFGNQAASITSSIVFPGVVPFAVRLEYAGDDNAYDSHRLGATNMTVGLDFPRLWDRFDLSFEVSEWQQTWYQHHIYPEGLRNKGIVIGHWFGEAKVFTDQVFGDSQTIAVGMRLHGDNYLRARYRTLANADYSPFPYERGHDVGVTYSTSLNGHHVDAELNFGKDVFGDSFSRLALTFDFLATRSGGAIESRDDHENHDTAVTEFFIDSGVNYSSAYERIAVTLPTIWTDYRTGYHVGLGVRRHVTERNDLGFRLEFDELNGRSLISARAVDYRFRFNRHVAASGFFGMSRYEIFSLPAYGFYWGAGVQWTNVFRGLDIGLDYRWNDKLTRTKVLTSDPLQTVPGGIYVDAKGTALYVSYRF